MKVEFYDPNSFEKTEFEFDDYQYDLIEKFRVLLSDKRTYVTQPLSNETGDKLFFGVMKTDGESLKITDKYKITIQKMNDES